jgi:hypothetical protein
MESSSSSVTRGNHFSETRYQPLRFAQPAYNLLGSRGYVQEETLKLWLGMELQILDIKKFWDLLNFSSPRLNTTPYNHSLPLSLFPLPTTISSEIVSSSFYFLASLARHGKWSDSMD